MKELKVNWDEAPEGANLAVFQDDHYQWWFDADVEKGSYRWRVVGANGWMPVHENLKKVLGMPGRKHVWKPEPYVFSAKDLKKTEAYKQLKTFIAANGGTPADLGLLVKRVVQRARSGGGHIIAPGPRTWVSGLFTWDETVEGFDFWHFVSTGGMVNNINPCPINPQKEKVVGKPAEDKVAVVKVARPARQQRFGEMVGVALPLGQMAVVAAHNKPAVKPQEQIEAVEKKPNKVGWW